MCLSLLGSSRKPKQECCMQIDEGRQLVEEPRALIPDVENGGRQCGSANNNLVMKNDMCKSRIKIHRVCERERHKVVMYYAKGNNYE